MMDSFGAPETTGSFVVHETYKQIPWLDAEADQLLEQLDPLFLERRILHDAIALLRSSCHLLVADPCFGVDSPEVFQTRHSLQKATDQLALVQGHISDFQCRLREIAAQYTFVSAL